MDVNKILFFLFLLLPFQFSLGSFGGSDLAIARVIVPTLFLFWFLQGLVRKSVMLPKPFTFFALSAFLLWAALSLYWAGNFLWAFDKLIFWLTFFPLFFVLVDIFREEKKRVSAIEGLVYGSVITGFVGILQFGAQFLFSVETVRDASFKLMPFFLGTNFAEAVIEYPSVLVNIGGATLLRAFAFFPDPHIFAFYTGMIIPLAFWLASKKRKLIISLSPWLLLIATLLSFSRAAYIALLFSALVYLFFFFARHKKKISVFLVLLLPTLFLMILVTPVADRFISSFSVSDSSVSERARLWSEAVENIKEAPLLGVGLGNYPLKVKPEALNREPIYVHNMYLDLAVELGVMGFGLFLLFILSCLSFSRAVFYQHRYRALYFALLIFLTHSLFEYPLFSIHILILFLTLLALLYAEKKPF